MGAYLVVFLEHLCNVCSSSANWCLQLAFSQGSMHIQSVLPDAVVVSSRVLTSLFPAGALAILMCLPRSGHRGLRAKHLGPSQGCRHC